MCIKTALYAFLLRIIEHIDGLFDFNNESHEESMKYIFSSKQKMLESVDGPENDILYVANRDHLVDHN